MTEVETKLFDIARIEKLYDKDPLAISENLINSMQEVLQYDDDIYRVEMALEKGRGNCYAWAQIGALALESWGMQSALVLSQTHAHLAAEIHGTIMFIDPLTGHAHDMTREAAKQNGLQSMTGLVHLYRDCIPDAFEDGEFTLFFREEQRDDTYKWHVDRLDGSLRDSDIAPYKQHSAHVLYDSSQIQDVLLAIGDLSRYSMTRSPKYFERYDELRQYVPNFIQIDEPSV